MPQEIIAKIAISEKLRGLLQSRIVKDLMISWIQVKWTTFENGFGICVRLDHLQMKANSNSNHVIITQGIVSLFSIHQFLVYVFDYACWFH